jgi:hypothetical protein
VSFLGAINGPFSTGAIFKGKAMTVERPDIKKDIEGFLRGQSSPIIRFALKSKYIPPWGTDMEVLTARVKRFPTLSEAISAFREASAAQMSWPILEARTDSRAIWLASKGADGYMDGRTDCFKETGEKWFWQSPDGEKRQDGVPTYYAVRIVAMEKLQKNLARAVNECVNRNKGGSMLKVAIQAAGKNNTERLAERIEQAGGINFIIDSEQGTVDAAVPAGEIGDLATSNLEAKIIRSKSSTLWVCP